MIFNPELPFKDGCMMKVDGTTGEPYYKESQNKYSRMAVVTYYGTGTYGASYPTTVAFPFKVQLVIHWKGGYHSLWGLRGEGGLYTMDYDSGESSLVVTDWGAYSITWYNRDNAASQRNSAGVKYTLLVFG